MLSLLPSLVLAHPQPSEPPQASLISPYDQEIIVWGDPFLQWEQRWLVQTEIRFPTTQVLTAPRSGNVGISILRVRSVLDCDKDAPKGEKRWAVRCRVDDIALQALQAAPDPGGFGQYVLEEWDAAMTGEILELVVNDDRAIVSTDLLPMPNESRVERLGREWMRQVALRLLAPLQVELPALVTKDARWWEPRSALLEMPTSTAPFGTADVVHQLGEADGHWVVSTEGRAAQLPGRGIARAGTDIWSLAMDGVARFDQRNGLLVERVWQVGGFPGPSSLTTQPYHTFGQVLWLDDRDRPDLGSSSFLTVDEWSFDADAAFAPRS